jgi:site-specific DNA-methyltransferase (adenine-specific)
MCRQIGFDNLNPIIWRKIANASYEIPNGSKFLGKPYEPNAIIKNDIEFILTERKPGGYRKPTEEQRRNSVINKKDFERWFQQIWTIPGASLLWRRTAAVRHLTFRRSLWLPSRRPG